MLGCERSLKIGKASYGFRFGINMKNWDIELSEIVVKNKLVSGINQGIDQGRIFGYWTWDRKIKDVGCNW